MISTRLVGKIASDSYDDSFAIELCLTSRTIYLVAEFHVASNPFRSFDHFRSMVEEASVLEENNTLQSFTLDARELTP